MLCDPEPDRGSFTADHGASPEKPCFDTLSNAATEGKKG